ncbi:hypothetical protein [Streptomyces chartreusis]|uniref:hypothetical protein n=1 Tax=Streptomyces chartreusis TaxID=1969 RepID=UPI00364712D9
MIRVLPTAAEEIAHPAPGTAVTAHHLLRTGLRGPREREVLGHVGAGLSNPEIVQSLREGAAPVTDRRGRSSGKPDLSISLMTYGIAVARGARAAIANARVVSPLARQHTRTNSAASSSSPASVHVAAACCTHVGVVRARSVLSR